MIVAKFGGTAITAQNVYKVKSLVKDSTKVVVVSAIGKSFYRDTKVTDLLLEYFNSSSEQVLLQIVNKYQQLADVCNVSFEGSQLAQQAQDYVSNDDLAGLLSLGEKYSALIVSQLLGATYLEAADVIRFTNNSLNVSASCKLIRKAVKDKKLCVIGGFYGANTVGQIRTFSRGGGDVTGALVALALKANVYENWTDTSGIYITNPAICASQSIPNLSYNQMYFLAQNGANVLHPDCVKLCQRGAIPIVVGNYLFPNTNRTIISNNVSLMPLLNVTEKRVDNVFVTTVLHNMTQRQFVGKLHKFFSNSTLLSQQLLSINLSPNVCTIQSNVSIVKEFYNAIK